MGNFRFLMPNSPCTNVLETNPYLPTIKKLKSDENRLNPLLSLISDLYLPSKILFF